MASQAGISTLLQRFAGETSLLQKAAVVFAGSLLLWASAKVQIPFYPVPLTMQTFAVLAIGAALGWRLGLATVLLYLAEGAAGLPVFAGTPEKGIGLAYMMGPTGGYLLGYLPAAAVCGWLAERGWDRSVALTALAMLAGTVAIYLPGLLWLGAIVGWDKPVLAWGLTPFLLGDLLKFSLASAALPLVWRLVGKKG
ncbi:MAG TPA: biotin transporter BioY [Mesorhizobium sp.]|jgi:biotin transport system substrate-specific component|uniref:biotin transporter BioY n=1 Tax=Mesorhizobium sp. TaxID=1871066 RepID=UPI002DDCBBC8|nr:biotin transporter BioY [Mesorhizobium sp.]HEV2505761.1 biotin transporter BioY [Mesorhizobium sp.]